MSELSEDDDATFRLATGEELVMPSFDDDPVHGLNDGSDIGMVPADDRSIDGSLPQLSPAPLGGRPPRPTFFDKRTAGRLRARKVRRLVRHVEPWSVLKISLIFYFCLWVILLIAGVMLWNLAVSSGTVDNIETFVTELFALESFTFNADQIFRASSIGGLVLVVAGAGFTVLMAVLFNLISDVTGGMRFTVVEEETARPRPKRIRPRRSRLVRQPEPSQVPVGAPPVDHHPLPMPEEFAPVVERAVAGGDVAVLPTASDVFDDVSPDDLSPGDNEVVSRESDG
ncbi:MAG: hypothetical protein GWP48_08835 [Actinobacteria bacterium]|nr:hypothetical protein [Actinomycetota bacterium]